MNCFFFHLGSHILSGFGVINFMCPKNLQATAENVCTFSVQHNALTISIGGGSRETVSDSKWKEISENYVRTFYQKDGVFVAAVLIPNLIKMEESREVLWNEVINLEIMRQWCSISNSGLGLIIPN